MTQSITVNLRISSDLLAKAIAANTMLGRPMPVSLASLIRDTLTIGIARTMGTNYAFGGSANDEDYNTLSRLTNQVKPRTKQTLKLALEDHTSEVPSELDTRLKDVPPADLPAARNILATIDAGYLTPEDNIVSQDEKVARLTRLMFPDAKTNQ